MLPYEIYAVDSTGRSYQDNLFVEPQEIKLHALF